MTELLPLPKVNNKSEVDESPSAPIELSEEKLSNILTNMVRQKYFDFLEKLLADNYENSLTGAVLSCQDIKKCAEYLEFKAVRSCMIVHLYRESILNIFNEIRNDTAKKQLNVNLSTERIFQRKSRRNVQIQTDLRPIPPVEITDSPRPTKRKHLRNVRVQTDCVGPTGAGAASSEYTMSLDERIRLFEKKFRDENEFLHSFPKKIDHHSRFKENRKRRHSSISMESPHSSIDSSIHRSVERADSTDTEYQSSNKNINPRIAALATPIENVEIAAEDSVTREMLALFGDDDVTDIFGEVVATVNDGTPSVAHNDQLNEINSADTKRMDTDGSTDKNVGSESLPVQDYTNELKNSIWPCEFHMQRMKLHRALMKTADRGFRYSEKLRRKFEDLFGPDDNDEDNSFAPYSPTIELDEILMASCKKRIAPWIVKHLKPMSDDGLIENRLIFKKVAKHIAEKVIRQDQYPDEQRIKRSINDFFKTPDRIDDLT